VIGIESLRQEHIRVTGGMVVDPGNLVVPVAKVEAWRLKAVQ